MDGSVKVFSPCVNVDSPCVDLCKLDSDFVCEGCGRTIEEILKWSEYTYEQKQAVLNRLFDGKG